jgi:hypothetical protein
MENDFYIAFAFLVGYPLLGGFALACGKALGDMIFESRWGRWQSYIALIVVGFVLWNFRSIFRGN